MKLNKFWLHSVEKINSTVIIIFKFLFKKSRNNKGSFVVCFNNLGVREAMTACIWIVALSVKTL